MKKLGDAHVIQTAREDPFREMRMLPERSPDTASRRRFT